MTIAIATGTSPPFVALHPLGVGALADVQKLLRDLLVTAGVRAASPYVTLRAGSDASAEEGSTRSAPSLPSAAVLPSEYGAVSRESSAESPERTVTQETELSVFEEARRYFEEQKQSLLEQFPGRYIAIIDGKVVDSDTDFGELATRVYKQFGYKAIYMPYASEKPRVLRIPSPRIVGRR